MDRHLVTLRLDITQLTLPTLSFCLPTPEKIKAWADELPIANRNETARQLYHALHDLNHLVCDASTRYSLLEVIYPLTLQVTHALTKSFLSKNVSLNEQQRKIANITQSIYANITSAYRLVVQQYLHDKKSSDKKYMAEAIYRSLQCASSSLLCSQQLYVSPPDMFWLQFNDLFSLAEKLKLSTNRIMLEDAIALDLATIRSVYVITLLFYTCKPAQLRQSEQLAVYKALPNWAHFATLHSPAKQDDLFVIRLDKNTPPIYKSFFEGIKDDDSAGLDIADLVKGFNAAGLVNELKQKNAYKSDEKIKSKDSVDLVLPPDIDHALLTHLVATWGVMAIRMADRKVIEGDIELCVGLTATHYYVSGNVSFDKQMQAGKKSALVEKENSRFKEGNSSRLGAALDDSWLDHKIIPNNPAYSIDIDDLASAFDEDAQSAKDEGYSTYLASVINISDSGCCLQFSSPPHNLHSGEIIGIRSQKNWRVGAIRWLRHIKNKGIQIGVEFLSSQVLPCGTKLLHKTGETSDYMRALLLSTNDLSTLITPRRPFKEGAKAYLKIGESERRVNLSPLIAATGGFCQFKFNYINELPK